MKFPLPVRPFPTPLRLSERDHASLTTLAEGIVGETVLDFDQLLREHNGVPDSKQWKSVKQRQSVTVYSERVSSSASSSSAFNGTIIGGRMRRARSRVDMSEFSQSQASHHSRSRFFGGSGGFSSSRSDDDGTPAEQKKPQQLLWHGTLDAHLDDVMYGIVNQSESMAKIKSSYVDDNVVDSAILATVKAAQADDPFCGIQLRWVVTGKTGRVMRHRDFVVLEATGMTTMNPTGTVGGSEKIGFHIVHSLDVRGVPTLDDFKIVRGKLTMYQLFRQRPNGTVEVFAKVAVDLAGDASPGVGASLAVEKVSTLFQIVECAQQRKLNWMLYRAHADVITDASIRTTVKDTSNSDSWDDGDWCSVCRKSLKKPALLQHFQNHTSMLMKKGKKQKKLQGCCICSASMCSRCSVPYKLSFFVEQTRSALPDAQQSSQAATKPGKELQITQAALECCTRCVHAASQLSARHVATAELAMVDPLVVYRRIELFDKLASSTSIAPPEILDIDFDACQSTRETETSTVMHIYDRDFGSTSSMASHHSTASSNCSRPSVINAHNTIGGRFA
jgi:hypothetical protein